MGGKYDLVIFDMDGTLTSVRSSWGFVHDVLGVSNDEAYHAFINMEIDEAEFMRRDIALWMEARPGITATDVGEILQKLPLVSGIRKTIDSLSSNGMKTAICSGGIDMAARMIAERFGFDHYIADGLETHSDGRLTGEGIIRLDLRDKSRCVDDILARFDVDPEKAVSVGNSYTDIPMFERTGLSIAFNPVDMEYTGAAADHVVKGNDLSAILSVILEI